MNVQVTEEAFSSQKSTSNMIQHFKTSKHETFKFFLLLWVIFSLLDPDPDSESGSGSTYPIESGFNPDSDTDPDPQPCKKESIFPWYLAGRECCWWAGIDRALWWLWWPGRELIHHTNKFCTLHILYNTVLRIRDVYPRTDFFPSRIQLFSIPDPNFFHPGSRIHKKEF